MIDNSTFLTVGGVIAALQIAHLGLSIMKHVRGSNEDRVNALSEKSAEHGQQILSAREHLYATKEDLNRLDFKRDQQIAEINRKMEQGQQRIHERVDAILAAVSEVRGELKARQ